MRNSFIFTLLFCSFSCFAQQKENCRDIVFLYDGSVFKGTITKYEIGGEFHLTTWSGMELKIPTSNVKRVAQKCPKNKSIGQKPYTFEETGWYNITQAMILPGESGIGFGLQHSAGWKFNRAFGVGFGLGVENFTPRNDDVTSYPVFAELRGYLLPKRISPFYALGAGWGFAGKGITSVEGDTEDWKGGWLAQGQLGYRFGNHFTSYVGMRFQKKTRNWEYNWGYGTPIKGVDHILQKRFVVGIGVML